MSRSIIGLNTDEAHGTGMGKAVDTFRGDRMTPRYGVRQEEDGSWTVYDAATDLPAVVNDMPQLGHAEEDARDVARELDELMGDEDDDTP